MKIIVYVDSTTDDRSRSVIRTQGHSLTESQALDVLREVIEAKAGPEAEEKIEEIEIEAKTTKKPVKKRAPRKKAPTKE